MNIRSIKGLGDKDTIEDYFDAPDPEVAPESPLSKDYYGRKIYVRKMERLYPPDKIIQNPRLVGIKQ